MCAQYQFCVQESLMLNNLYGEPTEIEAKADLRLNVHSSVKVQAFQ